MSGCSARPTNNVQGDEFLSVEQRAKTLGLAERPLDPARFDSVCSADIYRAILEHRPYPVRGFVSFGSNLVLSHADGTTAIRALQALDFHVHVDLFMNPSARFADIVLPATTPFEAEGLKVVFEISGGLRPCAAPAGAGAAGGRGTAGHRDHL